MPHPHERNAVGAAWDRWGILASTLCLLHCLAVPLLLSAVALLPAAAAPPHPPAAEFAPPPAHHAWLRYVCCTPQTDRWLHSVALCIVAPVGVVALWNGYERHRAPWGLLLGAPSLALLVVGIVAGTLQPGTGLERTATLAGSVLLIGAHLCNRYLHRSATIPRRAPLSGSPRQRGSS